MKIFTNLHTNSFPLPTFITNYQTNRKSFGGEQDCKMTYVFLAFFGKTIIKKNINIISQPCGQPNDLAISFRNCQYILTSSSHIFF